LLARRVPLYTAVGHVVADRPKANAVFLVSFVIFVVDDRGHNRGGTGDDEVTE